jgi:hypothetical protein
MISIIYIVYLNDNNVENIIVWFLSHIFYDAHVRKIQSRTLEIYNKIFIRAHALDLSTRNLRMQK